MTDKIRAPWTPEQVEALNRFQQYGGMHPFTCGNDDHNVSVVLMAHPDGWHCSDPACDYRQDWAYSFMTNPDAWPKNPFGKHITASTPLVCSDERHAAKVADLERQLAALRTLARGYCPACGRGDAAPTVADWENERKRAEQADAVTAETKRLMERRTTTLRKRAEHAEAAIEAAAEVLADHNGDDWSCHPATEAVASALRLPPARAAATQATGVRTRYKTCRECGAIVHYLNLVIHMREEHPQLDDETAPTTTQATDDADLLAWAVILEHRRQQQRDGITLLLLPFPPCPTCRGNVHTVDLTWTDERLQHEQTLTMQPCGHRHVATLADIHRLYDHMADMLDQIRIDRNRPAGESPWTTHRIISEAKARVEQPDA